ncbi:MAG: hypothetical protein AAF495_04605 [Pseudomonadota bacterium]
MAEALERDVVVELLNKLGEEEDEAVLAAAREAHARVQAAELTWDALLVPERDEDDFDELDDEEDDDEAPLDDDDEDVEESPEEAAAANAQSLKLIEQLLAKEGISDQLRDDLEGYKEDIAEGEFEENDRRYLRALVERLGKGR